MMHAILVHFNRTVDLDPSLTCLEIKFYKMFNQLYVCTVKPLIHISVPLMLAKLAMRYHSLTFMVTKMFIITHVQ